MKWDKDKLRKRFDERAREQYMTSGSFASTPFGLDGIPFVRRDAIIDFILSLADESPIKEGGEDEDENIEDIILICEMNKRETARQLIKNQFEVKERKTPNQ